MNPVSVSAIASVFTFGGALLALPSLAMLVTCAVILLYQRLRSLPGATDFGSNPDAVLLVLQGITQAIGGLAKLLGSLAQWALHVAAAASAAGFVFGLLCWLTGRGLQSHAAWARISAAALLALLLLAAAVLALSLAGVPRWVMTALAVAAAFALHALWVGNGALAR